MHPLAVARDELADEVVVGAGRAKCGRAHRAVLLLATHARAAGFGMGADPVDTARVDRQMLHPLAVPLDEFGDEAGLADWVFDQLDDKPAEMEILPEKGSA